MAYGIKYQLYCKGRDGVTTKLVISEDGYTGAEIDRDVPPSPWILRKDSAEVFQGTSIDLMIRETYDFEYLSFYTNNPRKYKVELYRGTGTGVTADSTTITSDDTTHTADEIGSTTLLWSGYINPQQYSCKYAGGNQNIRFQATDGLGLLKSEPFTLTGFSSEFEMIRHCLDKISLRLGYAIAIGIHENNHSADYPPIAQTYKESSIYEGLNCYEVIEDILGKYDATITQWENRWRIVSYKDKKTERCLYTWQGVYEATEAAPAVLLLDLVKSAEYARPSGYLMMGLKPGGKKLKVTHDYGRKDSFLSNHDFSKYSDLMFDDWTKSGSFTPTRLNIGGVYAAYLTGYSNVDTDYIEQSVDVTNVAGQGFIFEIGVGAVGHTVSSYTVAAISMEIRLQVTLDIYGTVYYLTTTGWSTTPTYLAATLTSAIFAASATFEQIKVPSLGLPGSGTLKVRLMRYKHATATSGTVYSGVVFSQAKVYFLNNGELYPDKFEETTLFTESTEPGTLSDVEILAADAPNLQNSELLYKNILKLSDGSITNDWTIDQEPGTTYTLIETYLKSLASRNRTARQKLTGTIKGEALGFETLIKHEYNSDREFEIYECSWDVYEGKWNVTLIEWLSFNNRIIEYE